MFIIQAKIIGYNNKETNIRVGREQLIWIINDFFEIKMYLFMLAKRFKGRFFSYI
jgi:hypothetical protein